MSCIHQLRYPHLTKVLANNVSDVDVSRQLTLQITRRHKATLAYICTYVRSQYNYSPLVF